MMGRFFEVRDYLILFLMLVGFTGAASAQTMTSPNGRLTVATKGKGLTVLYQQQPVLDIPVVG